ncbi:MAG TPA: formate--tetrahydrofolate ligase [Syntrophorhabdaceae bacterium]|nr:formate--tetrahydrofolate ligase [Syntrophorhabdaceae bacterium]HOT42171.1 formate--tetrahydrofolate ligase [Syntrophorhabdaceae bacterium]HPC66840.1 formate--tetrahydrofolate ligase [Syntrophorhabdaceae bacterium]HQH42997.1 formate--tetrahydrofolate ligase [Syntrophorhabdaceae bacterium]HQK45898.1 formate--tetrahydrofolate ligase [Syntrophorhabdaceae bacterium]
MPYDATKMADWQISEAAERHMKPISQLQEEMGLKNDEVLPYGRIARLDFKKILDRLSSRPNGKYIVVTAITPTPFGEGKTTTTMGLLEGLGKRGKNAGGAIRQPSSGPTMNIKGSAAGGGNAQVIPLTEFSLGLTGDIYNIMNAHNLAMVALTSRMQHERNYSDIDLQKRGLRRLDIDSKNVQMGWVIDFCAQSLRNIIIGLGGKMDGITMQSRFDIAVSSELMAILSIARDLKDLRERIGRITVAYDRQGKPITTEDLEVAGAMCAFMRESINPTLLQTIEGQPVFVHAGPFANIALGQSSIIADKIGLKLFDYHITESGFAADIGFEKFCNVKCRISGLKPHVAVITTTIRALKMHGGGPRVAPGIPIPMEYTKEDLNLLEKGIPNLLHHIEIVKMSGVRPVVCINRFQSDTPDEIGLIKRYAEEKGARVAVSDHWLKGGDGALELADAVIDACNDEVRFNYLYPADLPLMERVETIAKNIYKADGVLWIPEAEVKARALEADPEKMDYYTVMVKTHLSLSHEPEWKGVPRGWTLPVRDVLIFTGAQFLCPVTGSISLMPGTSSDPAFRRIDIDTDTGKVRGLF